MKMNLRGKCLKNLYILNKIGRNMEQKIIIINYCLLPITYYSYYSPDSSGYPTAVWILAGSEEYERIAGNSFSEMNILLFKGF